MSLACLDLNFSVDERSAAEDFLFRLSCRGEERSLLLLFSLLGACHLSTVCDARMDNSWVAVLILFLIIFVLPKLLTASRPVAAENSASQSAGYE